jgi:CheY-like chemotaxis protein
MKALKYLIRSQTCDLVNRSLTKHNQTSDELKGDIDALIDERRLNSQRDNIAEQPSDLVVDDNRLNRDLQVRYLSHITEIIPSEATNGLQALKKLVNNNYECIWLDLKMPILGGLETVKIMRSPYPNGFAYKGPIFITTGFSDKKTNEQCKDMGATSILIKPFDLANLNQIRQSNLKQPFHAENKRLECLI